jgi:hypothetical protein
VGQAVNLAVERFVTVGETIADDNPDIKQDMYDACKEARAAGEHNANKHIQKLWWHFPQPLEQKSNIEMSVQPHYGFTHGNTVHCSD